MLQTAHKKIILNSAICYPNILKRNLPAIQLNVKLHVRKENV